MIKHLYRKYFIFLNPALLTGLLLLISVFTFAETKLSAGSGKFNDPQNWLPAGVPQATDNVMIMNSDSLYIDNNTIITDVFIDQGAKLYLDPGKRITINGNLEVSGRFDMNKGNISFLQGNKFALNNGSTFIWDPADNSANGATLFTQGVENFQPQSKLIINRWYNYLSVPLGSVVTGNFGDLTLNSFQNGLIFEWNQNNMFESHQIMGKLTIGQAWIVLDRSGSINDTHIGSIELNNVNSFLDVHNGDHQGSFKLRTGELINIGGTFNGIYNGTGNFNLQVTNDILNLGYMVLNYNSGIPNTGNGNVGLEVGGRFIQFSGDFRGIFNLTGSDAGNFSFDIAQLDVRGGVFMGQYACHSKSETSSFIVRGDLKIDLQNATSKFRINGLNSLAGIPSNLKLDCQIQGDLTINGASGSEVTTSGSSGTEIINITGNINVLGSEVNFNYGSHETNITGNGDLIVKNGTIWLSKTNGKVTTQFAGDLIISGGTIIAQGGNKGASIMVNGEFWQTGGTLILHDNLNEISLNPIQLSLKGDYFHTAGTLLFDNNPSSTITHSVLLGGDRCVIGGNSSISTINGTASGQLYFNKQGLIEYYENSKQHTIVNCKQIIAPGCNVKVIKGDLFVSSFNDANISSLNIKENGTLELGTSRIYSDKTKAHSIIKISDQGTFKTAHPNGLYGNDAATGPANGTDYFLEATSTIEYNGTANQVISSGDPQLLNRQYGILKINMQGIGTSAKINTNDIIVRTQLDLQKGELSLQNHQLTLASGKSSALTYHDGFLNCTTNDGSMKGSLVWKNFMDGIHVIPFGDDNNSITNITITPTTSTPTDLKISSAHTSSDNKPLPSLSGNGPVTNINFYGEDGGASRMIDRWYMIEASENFRADVELTYRDVENTLTGRNATEDITAVYWDGTFWQSTNGINKGSINGIGSVTINDNNSWGVIGLAALEKPGVADVLNFKATPKANKVDIEWKAISNIPVNKFYVQRSADGNVFQNIAYRDAKPGMLTEQSFTDVDMSPLQGVSYYRLKQQNTDGLEKYSNTITVDFERVSTHEFGIGTVSPNPFNQYFNMELVSGEQDAVTIMLINSAGQQMISKTAMVHAGKNMITINDVSHLVPGVYLMVVTNGKMKLVEKLYKYE